MLLSNLVAQAGGCWLCIYLLWSHWVKKARGSEARAMGERWPGAIQLVKLFLPTPLPSIPESWPLLWVLKCQCFCSVCLEQVAFALGRVTHEPSYFPYWMFRPLAKQ